MRSSSETYLEKALSEYNEAVNALEPDGPSEELLEAYVNRGCVLSMLEHYTSAMEDVVAASEMAESMEVDDGTYVKLYCMMGELSDRFGIDPAEPLSKAASRLGPVGPGSRHFDMRGLVRTCILSAELLMTGGDYEACLPFLEKAEECTYSKLDAWSLNRRMEALDLLGESRRETGDPEGAETLYEEAADIGKTLMERNSLEDLESLAAVYMAKAECDLDLGMLDTFVSDSDKAVAIIKEMRELGLIDGLGEASDICHNVSSELMKAGRTKDAESYLMKALSLSLEEARRYSGGGNEDGQRPRLHALPSSRLPG